MNRFLLAAFLLGATGSVFAEDSAWAWRRLPNTAFSVGESIGYVIKYGVIPAGLATMEVRGMETVDGRPSYALRSTARSNKAMDAVFKVRDTNESWMDVESLCALRFRQDVREGFYKRKVETSYDQPSSRFIYRKWRKGKEYVYDGPTTPFVQDILSSLYYLRTFDLQVGNTYTLDANSANATWPLHVHVRARETVKVPAGRYDCLKLEPVLAGEGLFQAKGKLEVWVTDDARRVPVWLRSKVMVGAFDAEMTRYVPGEAPAVSKDSELR